jgi:hypothetical protein
MLRADDEALIESWPATSVTSLLARSGRGVTASSLGSGSASKPNAFQGLAAVEPAFEFVRHSNLSVFGEGRRSWGRLAGGAVYSRREGKIARAGWRPRSGVPERPKGGGHGDPESEPVN